MKNKTIQLLIAGTFFRKIVESRSNKLSAAGKDEKRYRLSTDGIAMNNVRGNNSIDGLIISPTNCSTVYGLAEEDRAVVGYLNEWIGAYSFITSKCLELTFHLPTAIE